MHQNAPEILSGAFWVSGCPSTHRHREEKFTNHCHCKPLTVGRGSLFHPSAHPGTQCHPEGRSTGTDEGSSLRGLIQTQGLNPIGVGSTPRSKQGFLSPNLWVSDRNDHKTLPITRSPCHPVPSSVLRCVPRLRPSPNLPTLNYKIHSRLESLPLSLAPAPLQI